MKKNKGGVLIISMIIGVMLIVISGFLLDLSLREKVKSDSAISLQNLRLSADNAIDYTEAMLKKSKGNKSTIKREFDLQYQDTSCHIKIEFPDTLYRDNYKITCRVMDKYNKDEITVSSMYDKSSFKDNFYSTDAIYGCLCVLSEIDGGSVPIDIGKDSNLQFYGPCYIQGGKVQMNLNSLKKHTIIKIKSPSCNLVYPEQEIEGLILDDCRQEGDMLNDNLYKYSGSYGRIKLRDSIKDGIDVYQNTITLKKAKSSIEYNMAELALELENYVDKTEDDKVFESDEFANLDPKNRESMTHFLNDFKTVRVLIIHGDLNINEGSYTGYEIICDGRVTIKGNVNLSNSAITCASFMTEPNSKLRMTCPPIGIINLNFNTIDNIMKENVENYIEGVKYKNVYLGAS